MPTCVVLLAAASAASLMAPPPRVVAPASLLRTPLISPLRAPANALRMFSEPPPEEPDDDAFNELINELSEVQKAIKPLPPFVFGAGVNAVTVISALLAWFVTPPIGRIATLGSLGLGGGAGWQLGKRMRTARRGLVPAAIAEMVKAEGGNLGALKPKAVADLARRYSVEPAEVRLASPHRLALLFAPALPRPLAEPAASRPDRPAARAPSQFEAQLSAVYSRYLRQLLGEDGDPNMAMVRELGALRRGIGLRWNATAAVHAAEARDFLGGEPPPGNADNLPVELSALLWLSSALYSTSRQQVDTSELRSILGTDDASSQRVLNSVSRPIYRNAVLQAVAKYNRTEAPEVLQTARKALCLSEAAGAQVHAAVYDAQLDLLLDDTKATLDEADMEILGELEGMLQVRGASAALRRRTEPLYQQTASAALAAIFDAPADGNAISLWGNLAIRQQELQLPTDTAKATLIAESRRLASERLATATDLQAKGNEDAALKELFKVVEYASFIGDVLSVAGIASDEATPSSLAERYLGALSLPPESEKAAQALATAAAKAQPDSQTLTNSLFSMSDPALASARSEYAACLDSTIAVSDFSAGASSKHEALAKKLSLPSALESRLSLDAYYGWLLDASERSDKKALEGCADVRSCLGIESAAVLELYANTGIDELVLTSACEAMLQIESPLSTTNAQELAYLEGQLAARPGVGSAVVAAASE